MKKIKFEDLLVDEYVSPILYQVDENTCLKEIQEKMKEMGFRHVPVLKKQKVVGIISDRDISLVVNLDRNDFMFAKDIMRKDVFCVRLGTTLDHVAFELSSRKIGSALILDQDENLEGIFTSIDGLNALKLFVHN